MKRASYHRNGFTIVELLIVVVVIGILAAIVIVAYNGVTSSARESAAKSDLANFAKKMEVYKIQNGAYPTTVSEMKSIGFRFNQDAFQASSSSPAVINLFYCRYDNDEGYVLQSFTANGTKLFVSSKSANPREYTGTDSYLIGDWSDSCRTHATNDPGTSVVEPDFEEFTNYTSGSLTGQTGIGTPDYAAAMGYWNTDRRDPDWHAWTTGGN